MARGKAQYKGDGAGVLIPDFSDSLKNKLRTYYPDQDAETDETFGHPADAFVSHILAEAWWAKARMKDIVLTKKDVKAEWADLLGRANDLQSKLKTLSHDLDILLGIDADPLGTADKISEFITHVKNASPLIDRLPKAKTSNRRFRAIAVEMSVRVLYVLKRSYQILPAATAGNQVTGTTSVAIQILKAIGDDIGLRLAATTWRDVVRDAKKDSPHLQK